LLDDNFEKAVCGMLHYYGLIPLAEILNISVRKGFCSHVDYKNCMGKIGNLVSGKKAYFYKYNLCSKLLVNAGIIDDMQKNSHMAEYKIFDKKDYVVSGSKYLNKTTEMLNLEKYFLKVSSKSEFYVENEVARIWVELNNMCDLFTLTRESIFNLGLNYSKKDIEFFNIFMAINSMANKMPRWFCKGYSYSEASMCYTGA